MGSAISGLIAEAVLQWLERLVFAVIAPKFWKRCVDDTFVIIKKEQVPSLHKLFNTILPRIEFTREEPTNDKLPFLASWYRSYLRVTLKPPFIVRKLTPMLFSTPAETIQLATNTVVSRLFSAQLQHIAAVMRLVGNIKNT